MINHYYINKLGDLQLLKIWTDIGTWKLRKWGNCWFFYEGPFNHTNIYKFGLKLFVRFQIYKYLDADHFFKHKPKLRFWFIGQSASPLYVFLNIFWFWFDMTLSDLVLLSEVDIWMLVYIVDCYCWKQLYLTNIFMPHATI